MKKILFILFAVFSIGTKAADSTEVTVTCQARDWEYISIMAYNHDATENLWDSLKVKFRIQTPPTGNTAVSIKAYTFSYVHLYGLMLKDPTAYNSNCLKRFGDALRLIGDAYLTEKLDALDAVEQNNYSNARKFGRFKLTRK